jgi:hypothetical protein
MQCEECKSDQCVTVTSTTEAFIHECVDCGWHKIVIRSLHKAAHGFVTPEKREPLERWSHNQKPSEVN